MVGEHLKITKFAESLRLLALKGPIAALHELAAGGEPSTWFPPGGLVETADTTSQMLYSQPSPKYQRIND